MMTVKTNMKTNATAVINLVYGIDNLTQYAIDHGLEYEVRKSKLSRRNPYKFILYGTNEEVKKFIDWAFGKEN